MQAGRIWLLFAGNQSSLVSGGRCWSTSQATMRVSVILSTYNAPSWLEKVLWGYAVQSHRDFELLVADDGSNESTAAVIDYLRRESNLTIHHLWQEDRGFRKCEILNRAICEAKSTYLIFSDGDCIPRYDFVAQHVRLACPGYFLSGGTVRLPLALSKRITPSDIVSGRVHRWPWLVANGMRNLKKLHLMFFPGYLSEKPAALADWITPTRASWNGHNVSGWRQDLLDVNGYDERMEYGGLDRELGERLVNAGVRARQIRHRAVCVHLDHSRGYVHAESIARNREIRRQTRLTCATWTTCGALSGLQELHQRTSIDAAMPEFNQMEVDNRRRVEPYRATRQPSAEAPILATRSRR